MIADHAITSELGGFHAPFPITFYMLQGSNRFSHATGIHLVNREFPPFRGFPEEEDVQICQVLVRAIAELSLRFERQNVRLNLSYTLNPHSSGSNYNWLSYCRFSEGNQNSSIP